MVASTTPMWEWRTTQTLVHAAVCVVTLPILLVGVWATLIRERSLAAALDRAHDWLVNPAGVYEDGR